MVGLNYNNVIQKKERKILLFVPMVCKKSTVIDVAETQIWPKELYQGDKTNDTHIMKQRVRDLVHLDSTLAFRSTTGIPEKEDNMLGSGTKRSAAAMYTSAYQIASDGAGVLPSNQARSLCGDFECEISSALKFIRTGHRRRTSNFDKLSLLLYSLYDE